MRRNILTVHYLEMTRPDQLCPAKPTREEAEVRPAQPPAPELNRFFYENVGRDHHWRDRLVWSEEVWHAWAHRPELTTWIGYQADKPFGYFELEAQDAKEVEISIFGLLPEFIGRGLGGYLLTEAVRTAWGTGARRVWLHTCSLDHRSALGNYLARGFRLIRTEIGERV